MLAFPNAYYAGLNVPGKIANMQNVQNEVLYMMQPELAPRVILASAKVWLKMCSTSAGATCWTLTVVPNAAVVQLYAPLTKQANF